MASSCVVAAQWDIDTNAQIVALTESNPRLAPGDSRDANAGAADVKLSVTRNTEKQEVSLVASGSLRRYEHQSDLDRDGQQLEVSLLQRSERGLLSAQLTASRDTTLTSELGTTGIIQDNLRHNMVTASVAPELQLAERAHAGISVAWQQSRYARTQSAELVDYDYLSVGMNATHDISQTGSLGVSASGGRLDARGSGTDIRNLDVRVKGTYEISERWRSTASAGLSRVRTVDRLQSGSVFSATLTRRAELYSLGATLSRSVAPTGRGLLARRDEAGLQLVGRLGENLDVSAAYSLVRSRDYVPLYGVSINDVRYARAEMSLNWRFAQEWSLGLSGSRAEQELMFNGLAGHSLSTWLSVAWHRAAPLG